MQNSCWGHQLGSLGRSAPSRSWMPPSSTTSAKITMIYVHEELHSDTIFKPSTCHGNSWLLHFTDLDWHILMSVLEPLGHLQWYFRKKHQMSTTGWHFLWANVLDPPGTGHVFIGGILSWLTFVHLYKLLQQGSCCTIREERVLLSIHEVYISFSIAVYFSLFTFFPFLPVCTLASLSGDKT